jgi:bifunctional DNA-binding transcriptional regulator/antitoxin component of YhaV-PrlF toxin-antitoxin module
LFVTLEGFSRLAISEFSEDSAPLDVEAPQAEWRLTIGKDGRVVIPAAIRSRMQLGADGSVLARVEGGVLRLSSPSVSLQKLRGHFAMFKEPGRSRVDEFIAERYAEQKREDEIL